MQNLNAVLSAVVVVALVVVALLLGVRSYTTGGGLDPTWATLLALVFGAAVGVHKVKLSKEEPAQPPPVEKAVASEPPAI